MSSYRILSISFNIRVKILRLNHKTKKIYLRVELFQWEFLKSKKVKLWLRGWFNFGECRVLIVAYYKVLSWQVSLDNVKENLSLSKQIILSNFKVFSQIFSNEHIKWSCLIYFNQSKLLNDYLWKPSQFNFPFANHFSF